MPRETALWDWLRDRLPSGHATRIENEVGDGFPDVHYSMLRHPGEPIISQSHSVTFELKTKRGTKKCPFKDQVRDSQLKWIAREIEVGGRVWLVLRLDDTVYFIPGNCAEWINRATPAEILELSDIIVKWRDKKPTVSSQIYRMISD